METYEEDQFQIDTERLKTLITNRTKALILNIPNNLTGTCLSKDTLDRIAKIAIENDLIIIADEIYTAFSYSRPFIPMATLKGMNERTIKDINGNNVFTAPSTSQRAALHALRNRTEVQPGMIEEYKKIIFYAYGRITTIPNMSVLYPQGSIYLFINIKKTGLGSAEVAARILREAHVLLLPGNAFGACGESYIRIAVTVGIDKL